jgi:hypothetical protein
MKLHTLKIWPHWLDEIQTGRKTFDIRSTLDRVFQAGDQLMLNAWDPVRRESVPRPPVFVEVTAVYPFLPGVVPDYVALSIRLVTP